MLQDSLPFALHLSSVGADLDENGPPVMNQIARGGFTARPHRRRTPGCRMPHGLRGQTPPSSSNLEGIEPLAPRRCAKPGVELLHPVCIIAFRYSLFLSRSGMSTSQLDQTGRVT